MPVLNHSATASHHSANEDRSAHLNPSRRQVSTDLPGQR